MIVKLKQIKSPETMAKIREIGFCEYCGATWRALHAHHITSRGAGGNDTEDNLVCLCVNCHTAAHSAEIKKDELRRIVSNR